MFTDRDGTFRTPRDYAGFRGTLRYVSLTVHSRHETGPCDDLVGWLYSLVFWKLLFIKIPKNMIKITILHSEISNLH